MDKASEMLYRLKPVTFKFNSDWKNTTQYGLIAEEVAQVDHQLVVRRNGETITVRYEQINAMLLNEFLKEHKKVEELQATVAQQQKGMELLAAQLKGQTAQIQKVSAQLEMSESAVSHQLRGLRQLRLVRSRKDGRQVFYALDDDHVTKLYLLGLEHVEHG